MDTANLSFETATQAGANIYWTTFAVMSFTSFIFLFLAIHVTRKNANLGLADHLNLYCTWVIVSIAAIAYYAMASNSGYKAVAISDGSNVTRSIYYARYIDWALTTPLLLLDLILLGNLTVQHTIRLMFSDLAMILAGLFGALLSTNYKWGFYTIACVFLAFIFWDLLVINRSHVYARDARLGGPYTFLSFWTIILWTGYAIVWGFAEGSNTMSVDAEVACYAILDILSKVAFGTMLLFFVSRYRMGKVVAVVEKRNVVSGVVQTGDGDVITAGTPGTVAGSSDHV